MDDYRVLTAFDVQMNARDLARLVIVRERSILESFERDAMGCPDYKGRFETDTGSKGETGFYVIEFLAEDLDHAWSIWRLGQLNHPTLDWDLRRTASPEPVEVVPCPDYLPEDI